MSIEPLEDILTIKSLVSSPKLLTMGQKGNFLLMVGGYNGTSQMSLKLIISAHQLFQNVGPLKNENFKRKKEREIMGAKQGKVTIQ